MKCENENLHHGDVQITCVFFKANIGQDEDFKAAREKAESLGAKKVRGRMNIIGNFACFYPEFFQKCQKYFRLMS